MAGVNPEAGGWKLYPSVMESGVDGKCDKMELHNTFTDGGRPVAVPSSGQNVVIPGQTQFTILYKGNMCIYDGIPAGKVREIMLLASTFAKSAEMKSGNPLTSLIPTTTNPSSPKGNTTNLPSPPSVCFPPPKKSPIRRLQDEFPIARRQSLQRFLEKRRKRLHNKAPYTSATKGVNNNNIDHDLCVEKTPDFISLNYQRRDFSSELLPL